MKTSATFPFIATVLSFSLSPMAQAEIGQQLVWIPKTAEETAMSRVTVRLVINDGSKMTAFCSGVSIGPTEVLTAGHCLDKEKMPAFDKGQVFVEFRDSTKPLYVKRIQVLATKSEITGERDIALLKIASEAPTGFSIPLAYAGCDAKSTMISAGFGVQNSTSNDMASRPKVSDYNQTDPAANQKPAGIGAWFQSWLKIQSSETDKIVVSAANGKACFGDSGGPVFCQSRGRLAVAGVNNQIDGYKGLAGEFSIETKARSCSKMESLKFTPIRAEMQLVARWRASMLESTDSDK